MLVKSSRRLMDLKTKGNEAESFVCTLLEKSGWTIIKRNFRHIGFELDVICQKEQTLAIVEVKRRKYLPEDLATGSELLNTKKRNCLRKGRDYFLSKSNEDYHIIRFDLAIVTRTEKNGAFGLKYYVNVF